MQQIISTEQRSSGRTPSQPGQHKSKTGPLSAVQLPRRAGWQHWRPSRCKCGHGIPDQYLKYTRKALLLLLYLSVLEETQNSLQSAIKIEMLLFLALTIHIHLYYYMILFFFNPIFSSNSTQNLKRRERK